MKNKLRPVMFAAVFTPLLFAWGESPEASSIKSDEQIIFFPSAFRVGADGKWRARIHGWIFEPEIGSRKRRIMLAAARRYLGVPRSVLHSRRRAAAREIFNRRARFFLVDNERGKKISIRLGGRKYTLGPSGSNGHFQGIVVLDEAARKELGNESPDFAELTAVMRAGDRREFVGRVYLPSPGELGVVSDIDDTIKISNVLNRRELIANAFYRNMKPVPFLADAYGRWKKSGAVFHYVSGSPWRLYPSIRAFMEKAGFPPGEFTMKYFRLKDRSFYRFLRARQVRFKLRAIRGILRDHPKRKFILVGDSGESDPEVYARIAREHPGRVRSIYIRDVRGNRRARRFRRLFKPLEKDGVRWAIIRDGRWFLKAKDR